MKDYVVTAPFVNFPAGSVLALNKDQLRRRARFVVDPGRTDLADLDYSAAALKKRELTAAVARQPLQFKAGETVCVIAAPGVNLDRVSDIAADGTDTAAEARRNARSRRAAADDAARPSRSAQNAAGGVSGKPSGEALTAAILAAIDGLEQGDDSEDFTRAGKPNVAALERELGFGISADERDAAWAAWMDRGGRGGGDKNPNNSDSEKEAGAAGAAKDPGSEPLI